MPHKKYLLFLLAVVALPLFTARPANACSCGPQPTVLESYEHSDVVVITRVVAVEISEQKLKEPYGPVSDISTKMVVEKVFKGNLKIGDEMIFGQGGGADCIWTFDEQSVGHQFLFYLDPRLRRPGASEEERRWFANGCDRSRGLAGATDDLLYLNNLDKVRGKTRISGTVNYGMTGLSAEGRKVRIIGKDKTYEVKTDSNGVYEIYDLPAGKYLVEPEAPFGWKIDKYWLRYSSSFEDDSTGEPLKKVPVVLQDKKHAGLNIHFAIDNAIRGKVYDPSGKPMKGVCVTAVKTGREQNGPFDCTDEGGKFTIDEVAPGSYVIVVNDDGEISSSEPFGTVYYPNVLEREKAAIITIGAGEVREDIHIYIPRTEETITVEGRFIYADGKPVAGERVEFEAQKKKNIKGDVSETTDSNGRFSLKILKGLKGNLFGKMYVYMGKYENCPSLEAVIKKMGRSSTEIISPVIEIQAENNLYTVELKYPFPSCKKAK